MRFSKSPSAKAPRRLLRRGSHICSVESLECRTLLSAAPTSEVLAANQNPIRAGHELDLTATFTSAAGPVDTTGGTVTWVADGRSSTEQFPSGAIFGSMYEGLRPGKHSFSVSFSGNANFGPASADLIETILPGEPELQPSGITGIRLTPLALVPGDSIGTAAQVSIFNNGGIPPSGRLTVELFLSANETLDAGDARIGSVSGNLPSNPHILVYPGDTFTMRVGLSHVPNVPAGVYHVLARVSGGGGPVEVDDVNSNLAVARPLIRLSTLISKVPTKVARGSTAAVAVLVQNSGNATAKGLLAIDLLQAPVSGGPASAVLGTWKGRVTIAAGATRRLQLHLRVSKSALVENSVWIARTDPQRVISSQAAADAISNTLVSVS